MKSIYLIGSLRNPEIPKIGNKIRELGIEAFDDWHDAGPEADDWWRHDEKLKGRSYKEALQGWAARHVFEFDVEHLDRCDAAILVLPAGKSGHTELGYMAGLKKPTFILFDEEPERWDVMVQFARNGIFFSQDEMIEGLKAYV